MSNFKNVRDEMSFSPEKMKKINLFESPNFFCDIYCLEQDQFQKLHKHKNEDKIYFLLEGAAEVQVGEETRVLKENDICLAPKGLDHGVINKEAERAVLLVFMAPHPSFKRI